VNTFILATMNSMASDKRRPVQFIAAISSALRSPVRARIYVVIDLVERRFADFARIPYLAPASRQQWEELWEQALRQASRT
jgi:hypothetical protein